MKIVFKCLFAMLVFGCVALPVLSKVEPIQSTQGVEDIEFSNIDKSKPTSEQINEQKQLQNRSKRYIKNNKEIRKQDKIRARKQIELEYIQKRLDAKKSKLESLKPDQVKGEKE